MILFTVGTNEQPFDRLVLAAATLDSDESLVVQHGSSRVPAGRGEWVDFVSFEELSALMRSARCVVSHAGVGSIMLARRCGKRPLVIPRRFHLGEAVDDHQLPLARRLHAGGVLDLVEDVAGLNAVLTARGVDDRASASERTATGGALAEEISDYLDTIQKDVA
jgi:UDP-N-acetylglucosamine transferase subunit ALG13